MVRSMTGFGRSKYSCDEREYIIEIKSVNHKYNDITVKIPKTISYLEESVKKAISSKVSRGKVDVFITFNNYSSKGKNIRINNQIAKMYIQELSELAKETNIINNVSVMEISKMPEVLSIESSDDEELIWKELKTALNEAMKNFISMRETEGMKIAEDLKTRVESILIKINDISKFSTGLVNEYVVKLEARIKEILKTDVVDKDRLAQEVVIYSDKCSVEEELTRLKSHVSQFLTLLNQKEFVSIGKRLDFIIQEMNREINTIGSKANSLDITNLVIDIKTELENVREQVQNIE